MEHKIDKATLRRQLLQWQKSMGLRARSGDAGKIAAHLRAYLQELKCQHPAEHIGVVGYWALAWEYSLEVFYRHHAVGPLWLPRVLCTQHKIMTMVPYDPRTTALTVDAAGIMAPPVRKQRQPLPEGAQTARALSPLQLGADGAIIAVILLPALAVNGRGQRLGYGGGYYDRWLASFNQSAGQPCQGITLIKLAVVHPAHVAARGRLSDVRYHGELGDFTGDSWDVPMDGVVSPIGLATWPEARAMAGTQVR